MISIYQLKPTFQKTLLPLVKFLAQRGVTANAVTIAAMLLAIATGLALTAFPTSQVLYGLMPLVLGLRMALNAIDGLLARGWNQESDLGALLNELGDCVADVALYLPFACLSGIAPIWVVLVVVLAVLSEFMGVLGQSLGRCRSYAGPMGKSDRALVFSLVSLVLAMGIPPGIWVDGVMVGILLLLVWTLINRGTSAIAPTEQQISHLETAVSQGQEVHL
ncbi:MAG: CDP-alcohol phosphatidyltransferase family protein [Cyanobacteria bacterium P01_F01_bin.150]